MITRVMNKDREAVGIYLRSTLVNSIGICSKINKYGLESDELYVYADFWADGEIKYVFSVADGEVTVFSVSNEVDIMDIYIYLRDNFIGYSCVTGEAKKVRDFMLELISNMYSGIRQFPPESKEYRSFMPVIQRIGKLVRLTDYYGVKVELSDLFDDLLYNVGPFDNNNAFLPF